MKLHLAPTFLASVLAVIPAVLDEAAAQEFKLQQGDRICILGNALADRMQHFGRVEAMLQARFPQKQLAIRNLGFCADELTVRQRTMNFGKLPSDPMETNLANQGFVVWDRYLAHCKADVIFAFFGFNESFAGAAGIEKFRGDLEAFIDHVAGQRYNGKSAPRLVLFSSIPFEDLGDPALPDGKEHNARIALYTEAMGEVAKAQGVRFVNLLPAMSGEYTDGSQRLTINGIHLNDAGYRQLAAAISKELFGAAGAKPPSDALVAAVRDKNLHWQQRYRVTDGYNVYGGRSRQVYTAKEDGQRFANYDVLQQEMQALDVMTANRDRVVWAVAQGRKATPDDSNLPGITKVKTNKPGAGPGGAHEYISGEAGIAKMTPAKGMKVNLFADEQRFKELVNPVQMAWDTKGRLWVAVWPTYPRWQPGQARSDKLLIFEDTDGDGKADVCKTFADGLINPTGFEFWNGGVYVASAPDVWFLQDTDGDDVADSRELVLQGLSSGDTHHSANSFVFSPGGALFFQEGTFHMSQLESIYGPVRNHNGCVWRFHPRNWRVERYIPYNYANPHGHVFDRWGQDFMTDGTGNVNYYSLPFSGFIQHPQKHSGYFPFFRQRSRPCAATEILSSSHFPEANRGNLLIANVIGFLGIFQYEFVDDGSGFTAKEVEPLVFSSDPNFRPSDIEVGPDGAVYFCDWHNAIIGHLQHHIRDPSRDNTHGRVYRVTYEGRPLTQRPKIAGQPIAAVIDVLKSKDDRARYAARIELSGRETTAVIAAAQKFAVALDSSDPDYEHHLLEVVWLHQQHGTVDKPNLEKLLRAKDPRARAAATRVLRYSRHLVPDALSLMKRQAGDVHPRVRLEAVVGASFFDSAEAMAVALESLRHPTDKFLDYALKETTRALEPHWKKALQEGKSLVAADNRAGVEFLLSRVSPAELVKLPRIPAVLTALLTQHGVDAASRMDAATKLAQQNKTKPETEVLRAIQSVDAGNSPHAGHVLRSLGAMLTTMTVVGARLPADEIVSLTKAGRRAMTREVAYALWISQDQSVERAWQQAVKSQAGLQAMLGSVSMIPRIDLRNSLYAKIRPLMFTLPDHLEASGNAGGPGLSVEYYSPAPSNATLDEFAKRTPQKTLTLPNFTLDISPADRGGSFGMVYRGSIRVAKAGRYTFFITSDDGSRLFVSGREVVNNDGHHGMVEKRGNIRLEVGQHPIIVSYFDQGGADGLQVQWRGPGFRKQPIPNDVLTSQTAGSVRHAAIRAMAAMQGREREKFNDAARLITEASFLDPAVEMIRRIPREEWPVDLIHTVVDTLTNQIEKLPATVRTEPSIVAALELGNALVEAMPPELALVARKRLKGLGGSTILIRTVPHKMLYDVTEFTVEAGKPVAIVFQNNDMMPHNLVITRPGALERVGRAAELLDGKGSEKRRNYIPETDEVLWFTKLLYPGTSERLTFVAPTQVATYRFVCTYPGHWTVMNGTMRVVQELGAGPQVVKRPADEDVAVAPARKFVKNWTTKDFDAVLDREWRRGRSADRGRALFAEAGCAKCHVVQGSGVAKVGPDLTEIGKKYDAKQLLRAILEPSAEILEGYGTHFIEIKDGDDVLGRIVKDDGKSLHVIADLEKPDAVTVIAKDRITDTTESIVSTMPSGLTVTLSRQEVLDLLLYLSQGK